VACSGFTSTFCQCERGNDFSVTSISAVEELDAIDE